MNRRFAASAAFALALALALLSPAASPASDMRPLPPVPSSRDKLTLTPKARQGLGKALNQDGSLRTKNGTAVRGANGSTLATPAKPPASVQ